MLTHCITLPDGTKIEFFSFSNNQQELDRIENALKDIKIPTFEQFLQAQETKSKMLRKAKQARKRQKIARRKHR